VTNQFLFILQPEVAGGRSTRNNERLSFQPFIIGLQADVPVGQFEIGRLRIRETRSEMLRLFVNALGRLERYLVSDSLCVL